jgi:LuxR family transcriptional regulator of spore coat protein
MKNNILTKREKEIFRLLVESYSILDISKKLKISDKTVRNHISNVIQKLDVTGRTQAIIELIKLKEIALK